WSSLAAVTHAWLNRPQAMHASRAGSRPGAKPQIRCFRFQAGEWRVSVNAVSIGESKFEARKKLEERARKFGVLPPYGGWTMRPIQEKAV
ncbi:hypothetical protein AB8Y43_15285, partial [Listeria monocytogenes]|uniref:hypothetical protein n=1 Tax=Listeria monocytogenes TaxID=1639 RepID=UPI00350E3BB6